ncbi:hypothetical protein [Streptomyces sp. TRM68367]|uniref:hypothetical protein n=1 Tax=Streptomyces sp. TRM68367 TaxID=2758415 RepID=UPI00165A7ECA|nr:hypothetical protein [Streptomyces sp. TRM68367]MBC9728701.1 hypothetical protein [Streptomyces sp. TRM68367]
MAALAVIIPLFMLGMVLALGRYEELLFPREPQRGTERGTGRRERLRVRVAAPARGADVWPAEAAAPSRDSCDTAARPAGAPAPSAEAVAPPGDRGDGLVLPATSSRAARASRARAGTPAPSP